MDTITLIVVSLVIGNEIYRAVSWAYRERALIRAFLEREKELLALIKKQQNLLVSKDLVTYASLQEQDKAQDVSPNPVQVVQQPNEPVDPLEQLHMEDAYTFTSSTGQ